jgi:hypothetical protein
MTKDHVFIHLPRRTPDAKHHAMHANQMQSDSFLSVVAVEPGQQLCF